MIRFFFGVAALCLIFSAPSLVAEETYSIGAEGGAKLAADLGNLQPSTNAVWRGVLKIHRHGHTVSIPVSGQVAPDDSYWKVGYATSATADLGAEQLTVIHATDRPNQYLYARAPSPDASLPELKPFSAAQADVPLAGSDFWLSDLGFEFYHWPVQHLLKIETKRSRPCYVLESVNPAAKPGGYSRVVTWVDVETGGPIQASAYGADSKVFKEFELGSFKKVNGRYELKDMEITDDRKDSRTKLEFELEKE